MAGRCLLPQRALLLAAAGLIAAGAFAAEQPAWPGRTWTRCPPGALGLDAAKLKAFSDFVGGRGCVVWGGRLVYTWSDAARRADVASAAKVFYSHFLFKAVELGRLRSVEEKVLPWEPRLGRINAALGHKDRLITFRHLANQTSCYGLVERPGTAFAYNDWQMALFWETLFGKVYGAATAEVDAKVFRPLLTDPLGCEDRPTMLAFGRGDRAGRVAISPRDFCRFGLLYLRGGRWKDRRLLGEAFVRRAVSEPLPNRIPRAGSRPAEMIPHQRSIGSRRIPDNQTDHMGSYSWLWWTNGIDRQGRRHWPDAPKDTYGAFGHGGIRAMVVLPSLDIVVSWNDARTRGREKENAALALLCAAVRDRPAAGSAHGAGAGARGPAGPAGPTGPTEAVWPGQTWPRASCAQARMDEALLGKARDYALRGGGAGYVVRGGRLVFHWGDPKRRYDLKSSTKAIGITALALAVADGKMTLADRADRHHPDLKATVGGRPRPDWAGQITLFHLATQTAGYDKPGGSAELLFRPGTKWSYSDSGPNWLAECVTLAYRRDLSELLFERVFGPLGITTKDLTWRRNAYRPAKIAGVMRREFGSGISANVDAMARIGLLYLREGRWAGRQILPRAFVAACRTTPPAVRGLPVVRPETYGKASDHYGLLWWNNADGTLKGVPRDAYWSWGLYDSLILVIPSLEMVVSRAGRSLPGGRGAHYDKLAPFFGPLVASVRARRARAPGPEPGPAPPADGAPCPPSPVIRSLRWAPPETIVRRARGSDNWPLTWADDGHLYTAYGDGWGFAPRPPRKLSLGLARVEGPPEAFRGVNIPSATAEQVGDGPRGKKASGMLCVGAVLYMLVRNAALSQLAWSEDHGRSWQWAAWRFREALACPTFLNFGRSGAGARDGFVYLYSFDARDAYTPADRMVLARVPAGQVRRREAYEFFAGLDPAGRPRWTADIRRRAAVFRNPGRCYRSNVSYCAPLKRYLWAQVVPGRGEGRPAGLGIFDAPEPWGPWTTVCYAERWDVDPGESASLPTKWMAPDGRSMWLVFSGADCFAVRKATLRLARP